MSFPDMRKWHIADCVISYGLSCAKCGQFDSRVFRIETRQVTIPEFNEDFEMALLGPKIHAGQSDESFRYEMLHRLWMQVEHRPQFPIRLLESLVIHLAEF